MEIISNIQVVSPRQWSSTGFVSGPKWRPKTSTNC